MAAATVSSGFVDANERVIFAISDVGDDYYDSLDAIGANSSSV